MNAFFYFAAVCGLVGAVALARAALNLRTRRRERLRLRISAHRGERIFAGRDWTLPTQERRLRLPQGCITPELLQGIAGIALMIVLALMMAACFADEPRW